MKEIWMSPELTVLLKKRADEVILQGCKESAGAESSTFGACLYESGNNDCYYNCMGTNTTGG